MLPSTTATKNNSVVSKINLPRFTQKTTTERYYFLLIHLLFYIIVLVIIYIRLEQFNNKQDKLFAALNSNYNLTTHHEPQSQLLNHSYNIDCSCQTFPYPKKNRTTRCLDVRVGLTETISNVFCPIPRTDHEQNQWLVIQNRQTNHVNFNRTWLEYRRGFGNILNQTDFWIGNENLYWLTNNYQCRLRIELTDWHNETRTATYEVFRIANQNDDYRIQLSEYNGNIETSDKSDSFSRWHHNAPFSTYDHHYAANSINCPNSHGGGGWWYHSGIKCAHVQLNGRLSTHSDGLVPYNTGILWTSWKPDRYYSFQSVRMSIQAKLKRNRHRR